MAGIYIHIPFCKHKCTYCDFASYPREIGKAEAYFACLYKEMKSRAKTLKNKSFDTVYFGGGTPSFIDEKYIFGAMRLIKQEFNLSKDAEITIEMNPGTVDEKKVDCYLRAGINRFSIGLQSADDKILAELNRIHNLDDYIKATKLIQNQNFSTDIMIGLPNETTESIVNTIKIANEVGSSHISLYTLKPEEGTIMYSRYLNGELPDEDEVADKYNMCYEMLKKLGYKRYEVSNFAKPGFESKHNSNYWRRGEYIGCGVSASSFIDERRFTNTEKIDEYVHMLLHDKYAEIFSENIEGDERKFEYLMLAFRTSRGVIYDEYYNAFKSDFKKDFEPNIKILSSYLDDNGERMKIKDEFLLVQNSIIIQFMD